VTRRTLLLIALLLALAVPVSGQRRQTFEVITVSNSVVMISASTLSGMNAGQGVLETAAIRYRCDGVAVSASVGTPLQVGSTIAFGNVVDARACQFIRSGSSDGSLSLNFWQ